MSRSAIDLTGQSFGRLKVLARNPSLSKEAMWFCQCECGTYTTVRGGSLRSGRIVSCGCWQRDKSTTHGMYGTPEYRSWNQAKNRCHNKRAPKFKSYGARGISMCREWRNSFAKFYEHIGPRPDGTSIDRINNDGNYEPGNVRWATADVQQNNRRQRRKRS